MKHFKTFGTVGDKPRSGRPKLTNERDVSFICRQVRINPRLTAKKIAGTFKTHSGKRISRRTVSRILTSHKLFFFCHS